MISQPRWKIELSSTTVPENGRRGKSAKEAGDSIKTIIIGHKNPDTDSIASAHAYAELKKMLGMKNVSAACPGLPTEKTRFLFKKFAVPLPPVLEDVYPRVRDISTSSFVSASSESTLMDALELLQSSRQIRIPVVEQSVRFFGMISLFDLAGKFLQKPENPQGRHSINGSLISREVTTSVKLVAKSLNAKVICSKNIDSLNTYDVYVGAMSEKKLRSIIKKKRRNRLALVVGDRDDIQSLAVETGVPLMIVTGNSDVPPELAMKAESKGISILQTPFDSASSIRRLKFSLPVNLILQDNSLTFSADEKLSDIFDKLISGPDDVFPVVSKDLKLEGVFTKFDLEKTSPVNLILVDHNELDQAIPGAYEVPVIEIIDHHKLGMPQTNVPVTVFNDVVGSTCTLVSELYRKFGKRPRRQTAGILMGGIITDTLCLRSPTSTERDSSALRWLSKIADCTPLELSSEIISAGSIIAGMSPSNVLLADRKDYKVGNLTVAISQVEESGFENFSSRKDALYREILGVVEKENLDFFGLLVTNVIRETSVLLAAGKENLLDKVPWPRLEKNLFELEGVLSRKKQLLPKILSAFN